VVDDQGVLRRIEALVAEENALRAREQDDAQTSSQTPLLEDRDRLDSIAVELDRCWDLLRQRRALRETGGDPDDAEARDAGTVERYLQ
jgi:Protein of unknown function (DUF2630)